MKIADLILGLEKKMGKSFVKDSEVLFKFTKPTYIKVTSPLGILFFNDVDTLGMLGGSYPDLTHLAFDLEELSSILQLFKGKELSLNLTLDSRVALANDLLPLWILDSSLATGDNLEILKSSEFSESDTQKILNTLNSVKSGLKKSLFKESTLINLSLSQGVSKTLNPLSLTVTPLGLENVRGETDYDIFIDKGLVKILTSLFQKSSAMRLEVKNSSYTFKNSSVELIVPAPEANLKLFNPKKINY